MGGSWSNTLTTIWQGWYSKSKQGDQHNEEYQTLIASIIKAVEQGDVEALKELHQQASTTVSGGVGFIQCNQPIILLAATHGHVSILKYLLDLEVDVDVTDTCGMTALHEACKHGHKACLELLLSRSRDIDKRDIWGRTPLIKALVYRNLHAAKVLLERGANPNAIDNYGMTPLTTVIDYNLLDMVRLLVHHGADLNLICRHQHQCSGPPLYRAINNQNLALVQELVRLGATTQPCQGHISPPLFSGLPGMGSSANWSNLSFTNFPPHSSHSLQHENAVIMAMSELVKRGGQQLSPTSLEILMQVLAAHGLELGPTHEVLTRVLLASRNADSHLQVPSGGAQEHLNRSLSSDMISMLLLKLFLCSGSCEHPETLEGISGQASPPTPQAVAAHRLPAQADNTAAASGRRSGKPGQKKQAVSLHTQARRMVRKCMMASDRNVTWATQRLSCPPALKTLLLLKDVDRAFSSKPAKIFYN